MNIKPKVLALTVAIIFLLYSLTSFGAVIMIELMMEKRDNGSATDIAHTLGLFVQAGLPNKE
jgi:hypothetical protein